MNRRIALSRPPVLALVLALASPLPLACSGTSTARAPAGCHSDVDCAIDAHCQAGSCVADVPPVARVSGPSSALAHSELAFDGSGSSDPDDDIVAFVWSARPVGTACAPEPGPATGPAFHPVFPCAGEFEVSLVVRDRAGVESRPATLAVSVAAPQKQPPAVAAGAEIVVAHRCEGTPLACTTFDGEGVRTVQLSAHGRDQTGSEAVAYRWEWIAPARTDPAAPPTVRFVSGERGPTPVVAIATPGSAIAGRWSFVVTVTDSNGLSARDTQSVLVQNRPPAVTGGEALAVPHWYDAASGRYRASGVLAQAYSDPDGDPVSPSWQFRTGAPDHCSFGLAGAPSSTFELSCADPAELIGAVQREIALTVSDANGGSASASWTVAVTNRPPIIAPVPPTLPFQHGVDDPIAPTQFLVQGGSPFTATDPDGDPLPPVALTAQVDAATGAHSTGRITTDALGAPRFVFATPVDRPLELRSASGASPFQVRADVSDPWAAAAPVSFAVSVEDRAPVLVSTPGALTLEHRYDGTAYLAEGPLGVFTDPDGDPLAVADAGSTPDCTGFSVLRTAVGDRVWMSCRLPYLASSGAPPPLAQFLSQRAAIRVGDPWGAAATASLPVQITNRPPAGTLGSGPVVIGTGVTCTADASGYYLSTSVTPVDARLADPDGDPIQPTWKVTSASGGSACGGVSYAKVCTPGTPSCIASIVTCAARTTYPVAQVTLTAGDGAASFSASQAVDSTCLVPGATDE